MTASGTLKVAAHSDREIKITRSFNAPRQLVWDAHTKPELLKKWLFGPDGWSLAVCNIDLRVGGRFRYVWRNQGGHEMAMGGEYREIKPPEKIVSTEEFDDPWYPGVGVGTLVLTEKDGKTTLTQTVQYESKEARDAVLKSPMEQGLAMGYDRLDKLVTTQAGR